jgi:hypothetical protein
MIVLFNQFLFMPHLSGGWIILTKDKMLTNMDVNKLDTKFERDKLFVLFESFISAHETWDQHFTCCIYIFVQCSFNREEEAKRNGSLSPKSVQ